MGPMGNVDTGQWGTGGMSHMGNGAYGQCRHRGQWGTGGMGTWPMRPTGAKWYRGMGYIGHRDTGAMGYRRYGTWPMRPTGGMGYRGMGNRGTGGMGYKGYGPHQQ